MRALLKLRAVKRSYGLVVWLMIGLVSASLPASGSAAQSIGSSGRLTAAAEPSH